jgi:hypothetical protein
LKGNLLDRKEAIALLVELGSSQLVSPDLVILELRNPDNYQLKIKGNYRFRDVGMFLKNRFSLEEINNYLVIFKHSIVLTLTNPYQIYPKNERHTPIFREKGLIGSKICQKKPTKRSKPATSFSSLFALLSFSSLNLRFSE